jgi:hypothetical protein
MTCKVTFVFGEAAVAALHELDAGISESEIDTHELSSFSVVTREFETEEEASAYRLGVEDANGSLSVEQLDAFSVEIQERVLALANDSFSPSLS